MANWFACPWCPEKHRAGDVCRHEPDCHHGKRESVCTICNARDETVQAVQVTFAIEGATYEDAVATFTRFMDAVNDQASEGYGITAGVVDLLPQPGDLRPQRHITIQNDPHLCVVENCGYPAYPGYRHCRAHAVMARL